MLSYSDNPMDFCQLCGGYDTIQVYYKLPRRKPYFHICEKCHETYKKEEIEKLLTSKYYK